MRKYPIILLLILLGCSSSFEKKDSSNKVNKTNILIGKSISLLDSIIPTSDRSDICIIYLFNFHDCLDCINAGFSVLNTLEMYEIQKKVFPVSTMLDSCDFQIPNNNYKIYSDRKDLIRRE